jgi:hypothetical protein
MLTGKMEEMTAVMELILLDDFLTPHTSVSSFSPLHHWLL